MMANFIVIFILLTNSHLTSATLSDSIAYDTEMEWQGECELYRPKLIHRFPEGRPVYGVQPVEDEVYIIRDSTPYIEVFDRYTFQLKRNLTVNGMQGPYDMVQSTEDPVSLFIADWFNPKNLTAVQVPDGNVCQWSFQEDGFTTLGLSGSSSLTGANILVTSSASKKLKEFSPTGELIREFVIKNISSPRQSIKVANNRYAVCHGYGPPPKLHQVCLVNQRGETIKCHGSTAGSGVDLLNIPSRLELSRRGCILVGDTGNKRVVLLNRNLKYVKDLITTGLDGPYRLYLDEKSHRLWVADNTVNSTGIAIRGRVLLFGFKRFDAHRRL